jgi:glucosamine kinase
MAEFFLGIDAGGTHCRSRLIDRHGRILGRGETGAGNTRIGAERLHAVLLEVSDQAFAEAGLGETAQAATAAGFGIAGVSRANTAEKVRAMPFPFASVAIASDAAIANLGAHGGRDGAVLIVGTGSIGLIKFGDQISTLGGYGFPISDEGSGAALGLSAVRHALRALDGRSKATALSGAVNERLGHGIANVIAWMDRATPGDYGSFAPLVMDYAEAGDEIAGSIVEDAVLHIERFITTIFARGAPRLALVGGLSQRYRPWLRAGTTARLTDPLGDPLDGALFLAGYREAEALPLSA